MPQPPLEGIRVLELARVLAGPWAGQLLADLGADVLKIEHPRGDDTRRWGPPFVEHPDGTSDAAYFHACNRGKRSVVLDLTHPGDRATLRTLAGEADVLLENFKHGTLDRFGLGLAELRAQHPRLVTCSVTGFGQTGPRATEPGYDFVVQAMSGIMDLTGAPDGPPQKIGVAFGDIFTGVYAVVGILAALHQRERTGRGQHVDLSLLDTMVGVLANQGMNQLVTGDSPKRRGNAHPNLVPYDAFDTRSGAVVIAVGNDEQFGRLCHALGLAHLATDARFTSNARRVQHRAPLTEALRAKVATWERGALLTALQQAGVPCGPVNTVAEALADPQIVARELVVALTRAEDGVVVPGIRTPLRFSDAELSLEEPSPRLGTGEPRWR